ncbi:MAG TPA: FAD-dependent oxidoreductase [Bryobacteraceae bacterium]|nr:FAD-dependent oxidoreductase [Bryobacteraceae bacterium]
MALSGGVVIVGGGQGGYQTAASLRTEGFDGPITLIGEEPHLPYQRPPLSKDFVLGRQQAHQLTLRPAQFYATHRIELLMGERAEAIDPAAGQVRLASGSRIGFDSLVLATGARNRLLPVAGAELAGVCYLRTVDEATALRQRLAAARDVVVIGGGFIGLEVAAAARQMDKHVTVVEALPRLMARVVAPLVSEFFRDRHSARGVDLRCGAGVAKITGGASVRGVELADGTRLAADLVIAGIGIVPNVDLARDAGLAIGNGVAVDQHLRTSDPRIFALGDCAEFPSRFSGTRVRLESVQNCVDQAICVARCLAGRPGAYSAVPWFWSDQGDIHLQIAGLPGEADQSVLRGDPDSGKFSVFHYFQGHLRSVDSINRPGEHVAARKLFGAGAAITPAQAADEAFDLKQALLP